MRFFLAFFVIKGWLITSFKENRSSGTFRRSLNKNLIKLNWKNSNCLLTFKIKDKLWRLGRMLQVQIRRELVLDLRDIYQSGAISRLERRLASEKFEAENAHWPQVEFFVIFSLFVEHLWCHIVDIAAHGGVSRVGWVHRPSKAGDFNDPMFVNKQVLGLDASMNDIFGMTIDERLLQLTYALKIFKNKCKKWEKMRRIRWKKMKKSKSLWEK